MIALWDFTVKVRPSRSGSTPSKLAAVARTAVLSMRALPVEGFVPNSTFWRCSTAASTVKI